MPASMLIDMFYYVFKFAFQNVMLMMIAIFVFFAILTHKARIPMSIALPVFFLLAWGISGGFGIGFESIYYLVVAGGFLVLGYAIAKMLFRW